MMLEFANGIHSYSRALIHLSVVTLGQQAQRYITPLSEVQQRISCLLGVSPAIYERLAAESLKPT